MLLIFLLNCQASKVNKADNVNFMLSENFNFIVMWLKHETMFQIQ